MSKKVKLEWSGLETQGRPIAKAAGKESVSLRDYVKVTRPGEQTFTLGTGDFVYLVPESKKQEPYVGRILDLFEGKQGRKRASVQWMYRPGDVTGKGSSKAAKNEIYYALPHVDPVDLDTVIERVPIEFTVLTSKGSPLSVVSQFASEDDSAVSRAATLVCNSYFDLKTNVLPLTLARLEELEKPLPLANRVSTLLKDAPLAQASSSSNRESLKGPTRKSKSNVVELVSSEGEAEEEIASSSSSSSGVLSKKQSKKQARIKKPAAKAKKRHESEDDSDRSNSDNESSNIDTDESDEKKVRKPGKAAKRNIMLAVDTPVNVSMTKVDEELLSSLHSEEKPSPMRELNPDKSPSPRRPSTSSILEQATAASSKVVVDEFVSPSTESPPGTTASRSSARKSATPLKTPRETSTSPILPAKKPRYDFDNNPGICTKLWNLIPELNEIVGLEGAKELLGFLLLESIEAESDKILVPPVTLQALMSKEEVQATLTRVRSLLGSRKSNTLSISALSNSLVGMRNSFAALEKHRPGAIFDMLGRRAAQSCKKTDWLFPSAIEGPVFGRMLGIDGFQTFRMTIHKQPINVTVKWEPDLMKAAEKSVRRLAPQMSFALVPTGDCEFDIAPSPSESFSEISVKFTDGHIRTLRLPVEKATLGMLRALISAHEGVLSRQQTLRVCVSEDVSYGDAEDDKLLPDLGVHAYSALYLLARD